MVAALRVIKAKVSTISFLIAPLYPPPAGFVPLSLVTGTSFRLYTMPQKNCD
jgi:hypothetical protein